MSSGNFVDKCTEIPLIHSAILNGTFVYNNIKTKNQITHFGFDIFETSFYFASRGVTPLCNRLRQPFDLADAVACTVLDEVKLKYPTIMEPTHKIIESGTLAVLHSSLAQKALGGLEKVLGYAEAIVTMVPLISASAEETDDKTTLISKAMKPVRFCYATATWPLKCTATFIHSKRSDLNALSRSMSKTSSPINSDADCSESLTQSPKKQMESKSFTEKLFFIPRYLLYVAGKATCERSERKLKHETSIETEAEDRKRKYAVMTSENSEEEDGGTVHDNDESENDIDSSETEALNHTLEENSVTDDADYQPCSSDELIDSFEYHSGSIGDDDTETNDKTIADIVLINDGKVESHMVSSSVTIEEENDRITIQIEHGSAQPENVTPNSSQEKPENH